MLLAPKTRAQISSTPPGVFGTPPSRERRKMLTVWIRDTLEQIDVSRLLIKQYPEVCLSLQTHVKPTQSALQTFQLTLTSREVMGAIERGRIASLLGVEG